MTTIRPVILSGGSGSRLWPASRAALPKQLLPLVGERTMLQETALRSPAQNDSTAGRLVVVCNEAHRFLVAEQLREVNMAADIILEPAGRNTAPAVALAALHALKSKDAASEPPLLLVMPADHVIEGRQRFTEAIATGLKTAEKGGLVCFGVVPTYAATGYGYIEADAHDKATARIASFIEKPDAETATHLLSTKRFFWNAGIFLMRADVFLDELGRFAPEILTACRASMESAQTDADFVRPGKTEFERSPADSIDYAVMEHTDLGNVVPLDASWNDVGSWSALHDVLPHDESRNTLVGDVVAVGAENCMISSRSRLVTAVDVEDLVIVEEKDAVLVTRRSASQAVKRLVDELQDRQRPETTLHRQVFRPWGSYDSLESDTGFQVKRLIVNSGAVLSLQKHAHRAEHWVVVRGCARVTRNEEVFDLEVNDSTYIPIGAVHRIENPGDEPVHIIEVQCGDYLGEDDIERIEDNYGRAGTTS